MLINRRQSLGLFGAAAGTLILPRHVRAQGARRSITIAVQKISNNNTLDIWREQSNVGERVFFPNLWEGLILRDWMGNQGPVPGLATEWKRLDDKTIELKLRQGVKFHNGDEMTAEDVVFSFSNERVFGGTEPTGGKTIYPENFKPQTAKELPASVPGTGRRLWPALRGVEAVDKYTVRFHNATPDVTLEGRLMAYGSQITSKRSWDEAASYDEWARKPVTTGAYMVEEYRPDVALTPVAFDDYWGGRPPLERIRFVEVPEVASRVNGLLSGEYDFACDLPPDQIATVAAAPGLEVQSSTIWNHRVSVFNTQNEIMKNPLVRRAMTHAIDRKAIVEALWGNQTVIPAGLQFDSYASSDMFIEGWTVPEYNPALARDLLKQAGYKGDAIPYFLLNNYYTNHDRHRPDPDRDVALGRAEHRNPDEGKLVADHGGRRHPRGARLVGLEPDQRSDHPDGQPVRPQRPGPAVARMGECRTEPAGTGAGNLDRPRAAQEVLCADAGNRGTRRPGLYAAAPERGVHRHEVRAEVESRPRFCDGFPRRQLERLIALSGARGHRPGAPDCVWKHERGRAWRSSRSVI